MTFSTKPFSILSNAASTSFNFDPLLWKAPVYKESIDLQNSTYRISNLKVDLVNNDESGYILADEKLYQNADLYYYLIDPTMQVELLGSYPNIIGQLESLDNAIQVFSGVVQKARIDDKKISLTVEDTSQKEITQDIPIKSLPQQDLLEKYSNVVYPIAYGQVKNHPVIIKAMTDVNNVVQYDILSDAVDDDVIVGGYDACIYEATGANRLYSPLKYFEDGRECRVLNSIYEMDLPEGDPQQLDIVEGFVDGGRKYGIRILNNAPDDSDGTGANPFSLGKMEVLIKGNFANPQISTTNKLIPNSILGNIDRYIFRGDGVNGEKAQQIIDAANMKSTDITKFAHFRDYWSGGDYYTIRVEYDDGGYQDAYGNTNSNDAFIVDDIFVTIPLEKQGHINPVYEEFVINEETGETETRLVSADLKILRYRIYSVMRINSNINASAGDGSATVGFFAVDPQSTNGVHIIKEHTWHYDESDTNNLFIPTQKFASNIMPKSAISLIFAIFKNITSTSSRAQIQIAGNEINYLDCIAFGESTNILKKDFFVDAFGRQGVIGGGYLNDKDYSNNYIRTTYTGIRYDYFAGYPNGQPNEFAMNNLECTSFIIDRGYLNLGVDHVLFAGRRIGIGSTMEIFEYIIITGVTYYSAENSLENNNRAHFLVEFIRPEPYFEYTAAQNYLYYYNDFIELPCDIIRDIYYNECKHQGTINYETDTDTSEQALIEKNMVRQQMSGWYFNLSITKKKEAKQIIESIAKDTPMFPKINSRGYFVTNIIKKNYNYSDINCIVPPEKIINYSFSQTDVSKVKTKVKVLYGKENNFTDTDKSEYPKSTSFLGYSDTTAVQTYYEATTTMHYAKWDFDLNEYVNIQDDLRLAKDHSNSLLEYKSDYITAEETAINLRRWLLGWNLNQHLIINIRASIDLIYLETGDIIAFEFLLDNKKAFGEDYSLNKLRTEDWTKRYGQIIYPIFFINKIQKSDKEVHITAIQIHDWGLGDFGTPAVWDIPTEVVPFPEPPEFFTFAVDTGNIPFESHMDSATFGLQNADRLYTNGTPPVQITRKENLANITGTSNNSGVSFIAGNNFYYENSMETPTAADFERVDVVWGDGTTDSWIRANHLESNPNIKFPNTTLDNNDPLYYKKYDVDYNVSFSANYIASITWQHNSGQTFTYDFITQIHRAGDVITNSLIDIIDIIAVINYILDELPPIDDPKRYLADMIGNGYTDIGDLILMIDIILSG